GSEKLTMLPEAAMAAANSGFGALTDHSDRFNSAPGAAPVTDTAAFSGGDALDCSSTSASAETKAKGKTTFPATCRAAAKRESTSALSSEPLKRISNRISLGAPGMR